MSEPEGKKNNYSTLLIKITLKMGFFYSEEYILKIPLLQKIYSENESKVRIISCADFLYSINYRVKLF